MDKEVKPEGNADIDQALKEFDLRSAIDQVKRDKRGEKTPDIPKMTQLVIRYSRGLIKDQKHAEYFLLSLVAVAVIMCLFLFFGA